MEQKSEKRERNERLVAIRRNAFMTCIIAIILLLVIQIVGVIANVQNFRERELQDPHIEPGIKAALDQMSFSEDMEEIELLNSRVLDTYLETLDLRDRIRTGDLKGPMTADDGTYIIREKGGNVECPDGMDPSLDITPELLADEYGFSVASTEAGRQYVIFCALSDGYYAVRTEAVENGSHQLASQTLSDIEKAYDGMALLLDKEGNVLYCNENLDAEGISFKGETGLDEDAIVRWKKGNRNNECKYCKEKQPAG